MLHMYVSLYFYMHVCLNIKVNVCFLSMYSMYVFIGIATCYLATNLRLWKNTICDFLIGQARTCMNVTLPCMHKHTCIHIHTSIHAVSVYIHCTIYVYMHTCKYIRMYTHISMHTYDMCVYMLVYTVRIYTYGYTYMSMCINVCFSMTGFL